LGNKYCAYVWEFYGSIDAGLGWKQQSFEHDTDERHRSSHDVHHGTIADIFV
jgi:hypothetical protein